MSHLIRDVLRYADRFGTQEWTLLLAGVIIVGLFCLRGFGSRSNY